MLRPPDLPFGRLDFISHLSTVFRGWIGLAFLGVPFGFAQTGLVASTLVLFALSALAAYCASLVLHCKYAIRKSMGPASCESYADVAAHVFGARFSVVVDMIFFATQFGFCVSYCIFVLQTFHQYRSKALVLMGALLMVGVPENLPKRGWLGPLGSLCMLVGIAAVLKSFTEYLADATLSSFTDVLDTTWPKVPLFIGTATSAVCGIGLVVPFESSLQQQRSSPLTTRYYIIVLYTAVALSFVVLATFGIIGAVAHGTDTNVIITNNLPFFSLIKRGKFDWDMFCKLDH
jgi:proton-coupled amino acid transporter